MPEQLTYQDLMKFFRQIKENNMAFRRPLPAVSIPVGAPPTPPPNPALERQKAIPLQIPSCVAVVGCGGVGSWLALFLALAGVPELWLFDNDTISESNLNRIPLSSKDVGRPKSTALAEAIKALRPSCTVTGLSHFTPDLAKLIELQHHAIWVACTTDTWASRKMAYEWSKAEFISYIEAASEGEDGSVANSPADFASELETQPGYASVPVWVGPCVSAAMMAAAHILHGMNVRAETLRLGWSGVTHDIELFKPSQSHGSARV
jgi:hypothetical protein